MKANKESANFEKELFIKNFEKLYKIHKNIVS